MASSLCCTQATPHPHSDQLLNHIVDCLAARRPQTLYAEYPRSPTSHEIGHIKFTYGKFANAINRIAWWIHDTIGPGRDFETLAYIGPNDLTYPSLILGAVKAGYKTLLLSPRNSLDAQLHLLKATNCRYFLTPKPRSPSVNTIVAAADNSLSVLEVPTIDELLEPRCPVFPYNKTLEEAKWDPLTVLHTSGSTGLPKPITWVQGLAPAYAKQFQLKPPDGYDSVEHFYMGNRAFVIFPPFHAAYVAHALVNAICNQTAAIIPLAGVLPSARSLSDTLRHTKVDMAFVVPTIIEELSRSPELLDHVSTNVDLLAYSGGDVPHGCGDIVARKVPVLNFYGTTEGASIALIRKVGYDAKRDWKYLTFHPDSGAEFRHHTEDIHELYIVRKHGQEHQHQIFTTFPDYDEYRTKDLYTRHESEPDLWRHVGRADDTIVFLTGEKVNPVSMEQYIFSQNPEIAGALIVGSQRFQAALLVELVDKRVIESTQRSEVIERIWPCIEHINNNCPSHARITKSHVIFTGPEKPLPRSPKGTIQRATALKLYAEEFDALYENADEVHASSEIELQIGPPDNDALLSYLQRATWKITRRLFGQEDNFFVNGMDSLQALLLARHLKTTLPNTAWSVDVIYGYPSISLLAQYHQTTSQARPTSELYGPINSEHDINTILKTYEALVDDIEQPTSAPRTDSRGKVFLLTGSTGLLGSHLLHTLLEAPEVERIYCLNRSSEASHFQIKRNSSRSLTSHFPVDRVTFLTTRYSEPNLGLQPQTYLSLLKSVTNIVLNAWPVNFKMALSSFFPQLDGVINFIKLAANASYSPSILFVSSVSAASEFRRSFVPEAVIKDSSAPAAMGYGQSKYLSERILDYAVQKRLVNTQIARVGQIAGPLHGTGEWNRSEWFPSLVRSSIYLGAIPESLGPNLNQIDWIPIDILARILVDLTRVPLHESEGNSYANVYNLLNPRLGEWKDLLLYITRAVPSADAGTAARQIEKVSLEDWVSLVRGDVERGESISGEELGGVLDRNPAYQLLDFYTEEMKKEKVEWITEKGQDASDALRNLGPVRGEWLENWLKGWE